MLWIHVASKKPAKWKPEIKPIVYETFKFSTEPPFVLMLIEEDKLLELLDRGRA